MPNDVWNTKYAGCSQSSVLLSYFMIPVALLEPMTEFGIEIFHTFEAFSQIQWNLSNLDPEYIRILYNSNFWPIPNVGNVCGCNLYRPQTTLPNTHAGPKDA